MVEKALTKFWLFGMSKQSADFATLIWYPLVIIHAISGKCMLFKQPPKVTNINAENCGLVKFQEGSFLIQFLR